MDFQKIMTIRLLANKETKQGMKSKWRGCGLSSVVCGHFSLISKDFKNRFI